MSGLPSNWVVSPIGDLIALNPKIECSDELSAGFVPMQMVGKEYSSPIRFETRPWGEIKKGYTHFANGDVLLAKITPCFENGKAGLVCGLPNGVGAGSTEYFVSRPHLAMLNSRYLYAFLKTDKFIKAGAVQMTGSVGHKRVPKDYLLETELPLAPLPEQKRIADKLDAVLARVDACRDRLDRIPAILKRFRQSVLAAATSGKLTEDWRAGQPDVGEWIDVKLADIANIQGGVTKDSKKQSLEDEDVPYLRVANVQRGYIDLTEVKTIRVPVNKLKNLLLEPGDIFFNEGGDIDKLGRGWIWEGQIERCSFQNHVFRARLHDNSNQPKYISWWGNSRGLDYFFRAGKQTTNLASINKSLLSGLPIHLPPSEEQTEIVRRVEALFAYADRLEARYITARAQVEKLTPSTLAKAFRGELVPQNPNDEPASALLERIRANSASAPAKSGGRKQNNKEHVS